MGTAGVPVDVFWREVTCLAGFSAEWAIFRLRADRPVMDLVRSGYWDGWRDVAAKSPPDKLAYDTLTNRLQQYAKAATEEMNSTAGSIERPMTDIFCHFLSESVGLYRDKLPLPTSPNLSEAFKDLSDDDRAAYARIGHINVLASLTAPVVFDSYFQIPVKVLSEAGLIKTN
jgi:hypothetical protein